MKNMPNDFFDTDAVFDLSENKRAVAAHLFRITLRDFEIRSDRFREVGFIDDEQIGSVEAFERLVHVFEHQNELAMRRAHSLFAIVAWASGPCVSSSELDAMSDGAVSRFVLFRRASKRLFNPRNCSGKPTKPFGMKRVASTNFVRLSQRQPR